jgi:DNA-binding CsgD family transcriptional regulator
LLRGEAGVGKTAAIHRFIGGLAQRAMVLRGWCDPLAAPRPLGPLIDMLAALGCEPAARLRTAVDAGDTKAIYTQVLTLFANSTSWVWVIEDVHWADGATLDLLRFLARRVESLPLLLIVSYRDDELDGQHPLAVALGDIAMCVAVTRIELAPLSPDAVAVLAAGSGVNAEELHRLTGGNPFYVTEVLAAGPDALAQAVLPRSVSEAVWGRLAKLSGPAREAARAVAVCGPRTSPALLDGVYQGVAVGLGECLHAGVLVADGDMVSFRHELARRATAAQIPDYQRRVLHARALAVLAEPPVDPDALAALVFHAEQAGDADAVIRFGPAAAERAAVLGAHREAAELYGLMLRHADNISDRNKVVWLERHAFEGYLCGQANAATRSWREAITMRHQLGDRPEEGDNLRWLSHLLWPLGRSTEATHAGLASLRLLEQVGPCPQLAWSLANLAELAAFGFDPAATDYAAKAIALGTELGEQAVVIRARSYAALAQIMGTDDGWDELEAAWRDAMRTEARGEHAGLMGAVICWTAAMHHDLDRAERYIADMVAFCADRDLGIFKMVAVGADALVGLHRGEWDQAGAAANDVLTRPGLPALHRVLPLLTLALIHARRGEQPVASLLDDAARGFEPDVLRLGAVWAARAEAAWLAGNDDTARAEAQRALAACPSGADPWLVGQLQRWIHLLGDSPPPTTGDPVTPYRLEIKGDWQAAAEEWTRRGCPYDAALAQLGGDIAAVESALGTFRSLGARAAARRAQQRLAQLRGRVPHGRRSDTICDPQGLTRREREVFDQLAEGHSDSEIAAALYISPRTVGNHVSAILAKLGMHNRTQAAYAYQGRRQKIPDEQTLA